MRAGEDSLQTMVIQLPNSCHSVIKRWSGTLSPLLFVSLSQLRPFALSLRLFFAAGMAAAAPGGESRCEAGWRERPEEATCRP